MLDCNIQTADVTPDSCILYVVGVMLDSCMYAIDVSLKGCIYAVNMSLKSCIYATNINLMPEGYMFTLNINPMLDNGMYAPSVGPIPGGCI